MLPKRAWLEGQDSLCPLIMLCPAMSEASLAGGAGLRICWELWERVSLSSGSPQADELRRTPESRLGNLETGADSHSLLTEKGRWSVM